MTDVRPPFAVERQFRISAAALLADIERLSDGLTRKERRLKLATLGPIATDEEEKGPHYEANILPYTDGLERIRKNNARRSITSPCASRAPSITPFAPYRRAGQKNTGAISCWPSAQR